MIPSDMVGVVSRLSSIETSLGECAVRISQENGGTSSIVLNNLTWARSAINEAQRLIMKEMIVKDHPLAPVSHGHKKAADASEK